MAQSQQQHPEPRSWTDTFRESAGALVVAAVITTFTLGGTAWLSIVGLSNDVVGIEKEIKRGGRYTLEMSVVDKDFANLVLEGVREDIDDNEEDVKELQKEIDGHLRTSDTKISEYDLKLKLMEARMKAVEEGCKK